ncbi:MAG: hypothetical protein WKG07_02135 [Hymenobacter sp.]
MREQKCARLGRDEAAGAQVVADIIAAGGQAVFQRTDLGDDAQLVAAVARDPGPLAAHRRAGERRGADDLRGPFCS